MPVIIASVLQIFNFDFLAEKTSYKFTVNIPNVINVIFICVLEDTLFEGTTHTLVTDNTVYDKISAYFHANHDFLVYQSKL